MHAASEAVTRQLWYAAVHSSLHTLGGDLITEIAHKAVSLRTPAPPLQPLYTLKKTSVGPGEFSISSQSFANTHPSFHKYMQLQVMRARGHCA